MNFSKLSKFFALINKDSTKIANLYKDIIKNIFVSGNLSENFIKKSQKLKKLEYIENDIYKDKPKTENKKSRLKIIGNHFWDATKILFHMIKNIAEVYGVLFFAITFSTIITNTPWIAAGAGALVVGAYSGVFLSKFIIEKLYNKFNKSYTVKNVKNEISMGKKNLKENSNSIEKEKIISDKTEFLIKNETKKITYNFKPRFWMDKIIQFWKKKDILTIEKPMIKNHDIQKINKNLKSKAQDTSSIIVLIPNNIKNKISPTTTSYDKKFIYSKTIAKEQNSSKKSVLSEIKSN
ncbi:MAG: hypothetical protein ISN64_00040 [Rickettsia sp.]|nr:hypothetical protein [Rickettsia sp.]